MQIIRLFFNDLIFFQDCPISESSVHLRTNFNNVLFANYLFKYLRINKLSKMARKLSNMY